MCMKLEGNMAGAEPLSMDHSEGWQWSRQQHPLPQQHCQQLGCFHSVACQWQPGCGAQASPSTRVQLQEQGMHDLRGMQVA